MADKENLNSKKRKYWQETLGAGLVVVGITLLSSNKLIGMLFIGFGLGYNVRPLAEKAFLKKNGGEK